MSTLAAARADNMYYPPEWRPEMGGISKFQGSKGANQYEQYGKIRFELPVHGWCLGCGRHIGRGTRFNATKDQAGAYFTTKIWQFTMKCPSCSTVLVIKTDPKNTDYEYVEGIRKKDMAFDPEEAQTQRVQDSEVSRKLAVDPLYRLEHEQADKRRAASRKTLLTRLTELSAVNGQDDYSANARLRHGMRSRKKKDKEREEEAKARGLGILLASPSPMDSEAARRIKYRSRHKSFTTGEKAKMAAISGESIFGAGNESVSQARRKAILTKAARLGIKTRGMKVLEPGGLAVAGSISCNYSRKPCHHSSGTGPTGEINQRAKRGRSSRIPSKKRPRHDDIDPEEAANSASDETRVGDTYLSGAGITSASVPQEGGKRSRRHYRAEDSMDWCPDEPINVGGDGIEAVVRGGREFVSLDQASAAKSSGRKNKHRSDTEVSSSRQMRPKPTRDSKGGSSGSTTAGGGSGAGGLAAIASLY